MYSLIKLLNEFNIDDIIKTQYDNDNKIEREYSKDDFYKLLDIKFSKLRGREQELFGENSEFSKAGSNSLQKNLYKKIICIIDEKRCPKEEKVNTLF